MGIKKEKKKKHPKRKTEPAVLLYIAAVVLFVIFLYVGIRIATENLGSFKNALPDEAVVTARVNTVTDRTSEEYASDSGTVSDVQVAFEATILGGARKGETVTAVQYLDGVYSAARAYSA